MAIDQLTAAGLEIMSLEEREEALQTDLLSISSILNFLPESLLGEMTSIFCERAQSLAELIQAVHQAQYPGGAFGLSLAALSALTGTIKRGATKSTISSSSGSVQLAAGATLPAGSVAHVDGDPTARFVTDAEVTNPGGSTAWVACAFTAEVAGPVQAPAGELTVIAEPVTGWLAVTNSLDAELGEDVEQDTELRQRRAKEVAQGGSTTANAIRANILAIDGVEWCACRVNETEETDSVTGAPAKSVAVVVHAPTVLDATIAAAIWGAKAAGIEAWGSTIVAHEDDEGFSHNVGFTKATVINLYIEAELLVDENYEGDTVAETAIVAWCDDNLGVGDPARVYRLASVLLALDGVIDVNYIGAGATTPPPAAGDTTEWNEIFEADTSRTDITSVTS